MAEQIKKEPEQQAYYQKMLGILGSLTNLFSESEVPYLNYRITENLFCRSFNAKNLARADVSADASLNNMGIGIKTFDLMDELGFIRKRHIDKKPWETENWTVEARITLKGRFLLKRGQCNLRYEHNPKARDLRTISVVEMER